MESGGVNVITRKPKDVVRNVHEGENSEVIEHIRLRHFDDGRERGNGTIVLLQFLVDLVFDYYLVIGNRHLMHFLLLVVAY